jgi:hypothetical protein
MSNKAIRADLGSEVSQVPVTPGGMYRNKSHWLKVDLFCIPADPKAISIEWFLQFFGVDTLIDQ